jgi:hypothetical protein
MKSIYCLTALSLLYSPSCFARLGDTLAECKARYGAVVRVDRNREDYPQYCFLKGNVEIRVRLLNDKSGSEVFFVRGVAFLSQSQIDEILAANSAGFQWKPASPPVGGYRPRWSMIREDGLARADYFALSSSDTLILQTLEFEKAFKAPGTGF